MERIFTHTIFQDEAGITILEFLKTKGFSRHILISMKPYKEAILLNGSRAFGNTVLKVGDMLRIFVPETESSDQILPVPMDLKILFEDEDILVLNKEANMPIHPSIGNYDNTLANGVAYYYREKNYVFRCINRLDRDTTGALVLAKNPLSAASLSAQMLSRKIKRTYLAVVEGVTPPSGTISAPIARKQDSAIEREVNFAKGEPAVTHYQRLAVSGSYSLVELHLETGRTHQIRVHMNYLGFPLPGDYLYHPVYDRISRQALHSYQLEFAHPVTGEPLLFTAPIPDDFRRLFQEQDN